MQDSELVKQCKKLVDLNKCSILCIVIPEESLSQKHVLQIRDLVWGKKCDSLSVVLHSSGGDISAAYKIVDFIRSHCTQMKTIIPVLAKSAATLFILGSDKVVMNELAEVGPLDTQMPEREKGSIIYTSALNPLKTLEEIQNFALRTLDMTVKLLLTRADYSIDEAVSRAMNLASDMATPLLAQLKTEKIGESSRALSIGEEYGKTLLKRHLKKKTSERDAILAILVRGYPSHDYIIDHKELKDIGFDVELPTEEEGPILKEIADYINASPKTEIFILGKKNNKTPEGKGG